MSTLILIIGNKRYSSWSLRPWLALRQFGIPFTEQVIPLYQGDWRQAVLSHSAAGRVPVLHHDGLTVWDSLAILEYLAERFPDYPFWPRESTARAVARAVSAEMHSGFSDLRSQMPMNLGREQSDHVPTPAVVADIERICAVWRDCRARFGAAGSFLFGEFGSADAMYAPVVTRFKTYAIGLDPVCRTYADAVLTLPAMRDWYAAARAEPWTLSQYETVE